MIGCLFCGSHNIKRVGGSDGNPYNRTEEKTICLDCGREMPSGDPIIPKGEIEMPDITNPKKYPPISFKPAILIHMRAQACNTVREESMIIPYADGHYSFEGKEYPFTRYRGVDVENDVITFEGVKSKITRTGFTTEKYYTAYDYSGIGWQETVQITIRLHYEE